MILIRAPICTRASLAMRVLAFQHGHGMAAGDRDDMGQPDRRRGGQAAAFAEGRARRACAPAGGRSICRVMRLFRLAGVDCGGRGARQGDDGGGAGAGLAVEMQRAAMQLGQAQRQRQAQAGAFLGAGEMALHLGERLHRHHDLFMGHADAGIGDGDGDAAVLGGLGHHQDAALLGGELAGIGQKIDEELAQALGVAFDLRQVGSRRTSTGCCFAANSVLRILQPRSPALRRSAAARLSSVEAARFQLGHVQHVGHHIQQAAAGIGDMVGIVGRFGLAGGARRRGSGRRSR